VIPVPWKMFTYSLEDYPFPTWVARSLEVDNLTSLTADLQLNTWQTDQTSPWHGPFYASFGRWQDAYVDFLRDVVAPRFGEPVYYQRVPTFRVHLPGNLAVGEFHTDAQYHHPEDEVSFWLPLTPRMTRAASGWPTMMTPCAASSPDRVRSWSSARRSACTATTSTRPVTAG